MTLGRAAVFRLPHGRILPNQAPRNGITSDSSDSISSWIGSKTYDTLIDLPEQPPEALLADKAYDTDAIREDLKERGIRAVIPPKSTRTKAIRYSKRLYRERICIERVLGHLKINRAIATRYDQLAESFLGMLFIASARYWIKFVHAA